MNRILALRRDIDWVLLGSSLALCLVGVVTIAGVMGPGTYVNRQATSLVIGLFALAAGYMIPVRFHRMLAPGYYAMGIILLLGLLLFSSEAVRRWIYLGPISVQPSELAKLAVIFILARLYDERKGYRTDVYYFILALLLAIIPAILVVREPDLGTGLVFGGIFLFMAYWAGHDILLLILLCAPLVSVVTAFWVPVWGIWIILLLVILYLLHARPGVMIGGLLVNVGIGVLAKALISNLHDYQLNRLKIFLDPFQDPTRGGYQIIQSLITIGHGGITGEGFGTGTQIKLAFLPARHTDFIFASFAEQWGFIGCILLLMLFGVFFWRLITIASMARDPFLSLSAFGIATVFFFQTIVNIGVVAGMLPITGFTLPLLSFGGSSLVVKLFMIGVVLHVYAHRQKT